MMQNHLIGTDTVLRIDQTSLPAVQAEVAPPNETVPQYHSPRGSRSGVRRFALAYAARAHVLMERGDAAAAHASMATAKSLTADLSAREASHVAFFGLLLVGDAEGALSAVHAGQSRAPLGDVDRLPPG
jgi:hypothetical protein